MLHRANNNRKTMPGILQTLSVPPPVSVPTLLYGIYQSVQNGGGGGGGSSAITGEGRLWFSDTPPAGWLICDGTQLNIADYPDLYAVIGFNYGGVVGLTFGLPDLRNNVPAGKGSGTFANLGGTFGNEFVTIDSGNLPALTTTTSGVNNGVDTQVVTAVSYSATPGTSISVIQPSLVVNFIIKT